MLRLLALFCVGTVVLADDPVNPKLVIEGKFESIIKNWNENKIDEIVKLYDENAKFVSASGKFVEGREAIGEHMKQVKTKYPGEVTNMKVDHVVVTSDMVAAIGVTTVKHGDKEDKLRELSVWKKGDGDLTMLVNSFWKGTGGSTRRRRETRQEALRGIHDKMIGLMTGGKLQEALDMLYDDDSYFVKKDGGLLKGKDEIKGLYEKVLGGDGAKDLTTSIDTLIEGEHMTVEIGKTKLTVGEKKLEWRHLAVWTKVGDKWIVSIDAVYPGDGNQEVPSRHRRRYRRDASTKSMILSSIETILKAWKEENLDEAGKVYDDNAKLVSPSGKLFEGKEAIIAYLKKVQAKYGASSGSMTIDEVIEDGNMAAAIGVFSHKHGEKDHKMRSLTVWKKSDGGLKLMVDAIFKGAGEMENRRHRRSTVQETIQGIHDKWMELASQGKKEEAMAMIYSENTHYIEGCGKLIKGKEAIKAHFKKMIGDKEVKEFKTNMDTLVEDGNMAVDIGTGTLTLGDDEPFKWRYVLVWKKEGDKYQIAIEGEFPGTGSGSDESSSESNES